MRAIALTRQGSTPALIDPRDPTPAAGEVLVWVVASSLNGFDVSVAAGYLVGMMEHLYPVVLGKDFAGTVEALGELATVNAGFGIARIPAGVDVASACALGLAGAAALGVLDAFDLMPGQSVLVVGATGGVGSILTQYAAAAGARVIATAGSGADFVLDHAATDVVDPQGDLSGQVTALAPRGVDASAHLAGDPVALLPLLAPGGRLASTHGFGHDRHPPATAVMAGPDAATLGRLAADVASGALRVPVTHTFTLDEVPAAIAAFPAGTLGKYAVVIG